jgi:hypothetical protein
VQIRGSPFLSNHFAFSPVACLNDAMQLKDAKVKRVLNVTTHEELAAMDRAYWSAQTPEARLDMVEELRLQAGKFLYEYPTRLRRVVATTRRAQR